MSAEIRIFKNTKLAALIQYCNKLLNTLNTNYKKSVNNINLSKVNIVSKKNLINAQKQEYRESLNNLKLYFNNQQTQINTAIKASPISIIKRKFAIIIGINYIGKSYELHGCINDALLINSILVNRDFTNIILLTDNTPTKPTKSVINETLTNMLVDAVSGDLVCIFYSGHGTKVFDYNKDEINSSYDQAIVPIDNNILTDDEIKIIINTYLKENVSLFGFFDSCYSGSVMDLRYQYGNALTNYNITENANETITSGNVVMLSGCTDSQYSYESFINKQVDGALTFAFSNVITNTSTRTWRDFLKNMRTAITATKFPQTPQLSSGQLIDIDNMIWF
jgi:hypothetical protein